MPDLILNTTGEIAVQLVARGTAVTGRTVTVDLFSPRGVQLADNAATYELGDGWYGYGISSSSLNLRGSYRAVWTSPGDPNIEATTYHTCGFVAPGTPTRGELRRRIAQEVGARIHEGSATASDDTTAITDTSIVLGGDGEYAGSWLVWTSGSNTGDARRVTNYDADTNTLTVAPAFTSTIEAGDSYLLLALQPSDIDDAINMAITAIGAYARLEVEDESLLTVDDETDYQIPGVLDAIHRVMLYDSTSDRYETLDPDEWQLLSGGMIRLTTAPDDDGLAIKVVGTSGGQPMYLDSQYCEVRPEYVIAYSVEFLHALHGGGSATDPDEHRRAQLFYTQKKEVEYRRTVRRIPTNSRAVRAV